mgnify:CR=1 FL=1
MPKRKNYSQIVERTLIVLAVVLMIFLSPLVQLWAGTDLPWYGPYIAWAIAIFLIYLLQRHIEKL